MVDKGRVVGSVSIEVSAEQNQHNSPTPNI